MFFKHFGSKNQRPGFYISGTLVGNRLIIIQIFDHDHILTQTRKIYLKTTTNKSWMFSNVSVQPNSNMQNSARRKL